MKLNDDLVILPLAMERDGQTMVFNVSLLLDNAHGPALVDTGLPGQAAQIAAALAEQGLAVADLRRIIITHQDFDHVGTLHELVQASRAQVLAHASEAPFIDGTELPRFAHPELQAQRPELRAIVEAFRPTPVDLLLHDDTRLDLAGGVRVVFTPGHTPGHISLYLERTRTLIAGDALVAQDGRLHGPLPQASMDMPRALQSVRRLAELDIATIICYHGGVVADDAGGQLRRIAAEAPQG